MVEGWKTARIYPIHKGGEVSEPENYRGVSLLDIGYKILASIMDNRLKKLAEEEQTLEIESGRVQSRKKHA